MSYNAKTQYALRYSEGSSMNVLQIYTKVSQIHIAFVHIVCLSQKCIAWLCNYRDWPAKHGVCVTVYLFNNM